MKLDEESWAELRVNWQTTNESIRQMAARYGICSSTLSDRALKEGWGPRPAKAKRVTPKPVTRFVLPLTNGAAGAGMVSTAATAQALDVQATDETPKPAASIAPREPDTPDGRAQRLLRLIDLQIDQMERVMSTDQLSSQDQERTARAVTSILGHLETVTELTLGRNSESGGADHPGTRAETERLRREIAERLERLNAQWQAQSKPGDAE